MLILRIRYAFLAGLAWRQVTSGEWKMVRARGFTLANGKWICEAL